MSSEHVDKLLAVASKQLKAARDGFANDRRIQTEFPYSRWYIGAFLEWAAVVTEALRVVGDDPVGALRASADVDAGTGDVRDRNGATFADHWSAIGTRSETAGDTTKWPVVYYRGSGTDVATDLRAIMPREKLQAMVDALRASGDVDQGTGPDLAEQLRRARARWLRIQPLIRSLHTWENQPGGGWQLARDFEDWQREEAAALDEEDAAGPPLTAEIKQGDPVMVFKEGESTEAQLHDRIATLSEELAKTLDRESEVREQLATARREYELARLEIAKMAVDRDRLVSAAIRLLPPGTDMRTDSLVKALDTLSDEHKAHIRALLHVEQTLADLRRGPVSP